MVVFGGAGNGKRLAAVVLGGRVAAGLLQQVSGRGQGLRARERSSLGCWCVQQCPQRVGALDGVSAGPPELAQRRDQPQARPGIGPGQAERDRGPQITQLGVERSSQAA